MSAAPLGTGTPRIGYVRRSLDSLVLTPMQLESTPSTRSPLQTVADAVARHYKEQFGRGPQRCRAHFAGRDSVLVVLDGTMTPAERRLTDLGQGEHVRAARSALQRAVGEDLAASVAAVVGRGVLHAVNGLDVDHDVATELFVLSADEIGSPSVGPVSAPAPAG